MKRIWIVFTVLFCFTAVPSALPATALPSATETLSELPWSTVLAVLKAVDPQTDYTFDQLVDKYRDGSLKITSTNSGYLVTYRCADGSLDSILISNL